MWRPKGWKNPYYLKDTDGFYNKYPEFAAYEAGADAMLEAIEEMSKDGKLTATLYGLSFYEEEG